MDCPASKQASAVRSQQFTASGMAHHNLQMNIRLQTIGDYITRVQKFDLNHWFYCHFWVCNKNLKSYESYLCYGPERSCQTSLSCQKQTKQVAVFINPLHCHMSQVCESNTIVTSQFVLHWLTHLFHNVSVFHIKKGGNTYITCIILFKYPVRGRLTNLILCQSL